MMHWYCAWLTPSRNTALGSGCICNSAFFLSKISTTSTQWVEQYRRLANEKIRKRAKIRNRYKFIQSSTTPDPGYQWESNKLTVRHHKLELRGQDYLQIYYSSASDTVLSKGTKPRWKNASWVESPALLNACQCDFLLFPDIELVNISAWNSIRALVVTSPMAYWHL